MILVDTSVWIDFFNNNSNEKVDSLKLFLRQNADICITDIVFMEILQGIKNEHKYENVKQILLALPFFHATAYKTFIMATEIYRECRKKGLTIRKSNDCIIGAIALENNLKLLTLDKDFNYISQAFPLMLC